MATDDKNVAKISALSSGKTDKYEYLTDEEILLPDQRRVIEQIKFNYSPSKTAYFAVSKNIRLNSTHYFFL